MLPATCHPLPSIANAHLTLYVTCKQHDLTVKLVVN